MRRGQIHEVRFTRLAHRLWAGLAVVLTVSAADARAARPTTKPVPPAPGDWKGKQVMIELEVDLDEDGLPTPAETTYLASRLTAAGADVTTWGRIGNKKWDLVVVGRVLRPEGAAALDPLAIARYELSEKQAAEIKAEAEAASIRVVTADQVVAAFKLGRPSLQQLRDVGMVRLLARLDRRLPEVNFNGVGLSDVLEFLTDVSDVRVVADFDALKAAGIDRDAPITLRLRDIPLCLPLELIVDTCGPDKVVMVSDGTSLRLTTLKAAAQLDKAEPDAWKTLADLRPEPDAGVALREGLRRRLPEIRFAGVAMADVIDFFRDVTGLQVYVSPAAVAVVKLDTPVTLDRRDIAADQFLVTLARHLSDGKLAFYCDRGMIVRLTTRENAEAAIKADKTCYPLPLKD